MTQAATVESVTSNDMMPADTYYGMYWISDGTNRMTVRTVKTAKSLHPSEIVRIFSGIAEDMGLPQEATRCKVTGTKGYTVGYAEPGADARVLAELMGVPKREQDRLAKQVSRMTKGFATSK